LPLFCPTSCSLLRPCNPRHGPIEKTGAMSIRVYPLPNTPFHNSNHFSAVNVERCSWSQCNLRISIDSRENAGGRVRIELSVTTNHSVKVDEGKAKTSFELHYMRTVLLLPLRISFPCGKSHRIIVRGILNTLPHLHRHNAKDSFKHAALPSASIHQVPEMKMRRYILWTLSPVLLYALLQVHPFLSAGSMCGHGTQSCPPLQTLLSMPQLFVEHGPL
jgi:hypothetical protein